jgi:hypothetical protein
MKSTCSGPVFVVGFFRSGTSLLYSLLNQHPRIGLMYECDVWDFPDAFAELRFEQNWLARQEFYNRALSRHRLIFGGSLRGLEQVRTADDLYRTFSASKGAAVWGEKSPHYCVRLRQLARRHPNAAFILLWREPLDTFRSVAWAAQEDRYFARPGMFTRFVFHQEQMIRQAAWLTRAGHRVHHVQYDALVDQTERVCSEICAFLGIDFDKQMLDLTRADFSAVYQGRHHEHLRRATIQRQEYPKEILEPLVMTKLARFGARWDRLQREKLGFQMPPGQFREPGIFSRMHYLGVGFVIAKLHDLKRLLLEFLPLPWLSTYRQSKQWYLLRHLETGAKSVSIGREFIENWATVLASAAIVAGVAVLDYFSGKDVTFAPFYLFPCAMLTLVIGKRWGTASAMTTALIWSLLQNFQGHSETRAVLLWNSAMRFILLQTIVLILDRVRLELNSERNGGEAASPNVRPIAEESGPKGT